MVTPLAGQLVAILGPFLPALVAAGQQAAGRAATELKAEGLELAKELWSKLAPKVDARPAAQEAAKDAAAEPEDEDVRGALRVQLRKLLADDPALVDELRKVIEKGEQQGSISVTASGDRAVAIGQNVTGSTIITGDRNRL